jgi:SAM-dependent methyltransferase
MPNHPGNPYTRRPTLADRLQLWTVQLSKLRRRGFANTGGAYEEFYEQFFEDKDVELYGADRRTTLRAETINHAIRTHLAPGGSILDVGCGLGDVLAMLPDGYRLHGMEYARSNVERASRRLGDRAVIREGSIYEIPWPDESMDAALCLEVIEHIEDDARAVRDIRRVLKPGGFLIAAVPYTFYWPQYMRLMGHFRHYSRTTFGRLLADNGLAPEVYLPNYPNWHQAYTRKYVKVRAQHVLFGRFLGRPSLFRFGWPWRRTPSMQRLAERLEPLRRRDAALDYASLETSTFILARKR